MSLIEIFALAAIVLAALYLLALGAAALVVPARVPRVTHHLALVGLVSLALGGFILLALVRGSAA